MNTIEAQQYGLIDEVLGDTDDLISLDEVPRRIHLEVSGKNRDSIGFKQHPTL